MNNYGESVSEPAPPTPWNSPKTILCLSHLRWNFVYQRPHHLMSRAARRHHVLFVEEPIDDGDAPYLERRRDPSGVSVVVPHLAGRRAPDHASAPRAAWSGRCRRPTSCCGAARRWHSTFPTPAHIYHHLRLHRQLGRQHLAPGLPATEQRPLQRLANLVLTSGYDLLLRETRLAPTDVPRLCQRRRVQTFRNRPPDGWRSANREPAIRIRASVSSGCSTSGSTGELLAGIAADTPGWHYVLIGPVTEIDPAALPAATSSYLGPKTPTANCPVTSPGGTSRCSRLRATPRPDTSARPRRLVPWRPASRWCQRQSPTSSAATRTREWRRSPTVARPSCRPSERRSATPRRRDWREPTHSWPRQGWDDIWDRVSERVRARDHGPPSLGSHRHAGRAILRVVTLPSSNRS